MAKSADARHGNIADNYDAILQRVKDSIRDLKDVSEIFPDIEKNRNRFKSAEGICQQFTKEKLEPVLESIFSTKEDPGLSEYHYLFDTQKMSGEKTILASIMLKFSSEYLLQAFSGGQFSYLSKRIEEVIEEIESMQETFDKTKQLSEELQEYKEHVMTTKPRYVFPHETMYIAECTQCKDTAYGKDRIDSINNVKHLPKCKFPELKDKTSKEVIYGWFRVLTPTRLEK